MASLKPIPFYVVFDGVPGPDSCKFVEIETEEGKGVGPDVAGGWSDHPTSSQLKRLGPFILAPTTVTPPASEKENQSEFVTDLKDMINRFNIESMSDTPDWVLANYLMRCLEAYNFAVLQRDVAKWESDKP